MLETGHLPSIFQAALEAVDSCQSAMSHVGLDGSSTMPFIVRYL